MVVYRCQCGRYRFEPPQPHDGDCFCTSGDKAPVRVEVTDIRELQAQADTPKQDDQSRHQFADAAMYARMKQLDPAMAEWYIRHQQMGFWYA